jgi:holo-[acyl-carrier protein] synthase
MIVGIGLDIAEYAKLERSIAEGSFLTTVFTPAEIEAVSHYKRNQLDHYAGKFAVKEAFMKAIGAGIQQGVWFKHIEVLNRETGAPYVVLYEEARAIVERLALSNMHITISHSAGIAVGLVILEKLD